MIAKQYPKEQVAEFALDAESAAEYETTKDTNIQELLNKAPGTLTPYEEQILIDAGFDDYVRGGMKGTDLMGDLFTLGLSLAAAKAILPLLMKVGGNFVNLIAHEHGMRAITDAAYKTFQQTGQMPPWYHWAFWKLLPQSTLNAFARIAGTTPAKSILATEGTAAGKAALHNVLKPAALVAFFTKLLTGDQRGAENLLETSIRDVVEQDIESGSYDLMNAFYDEVGAEGFDKLMNVYGDQIEGFNEKNDRLDELYDPEYIGGIKNQINEIDSRYNSRGGSWEENGVRIYGDANWGGQLTKQSFESSGQSFEEYDALRAQLGFFNGDKGPDEYGRYIPIGWWQIMDAEENGHKPEQFTGIAHEIVSRSYKMDEISSNPNFPREGRNIYDNEADYNEAMRLQDEYSKLLGEYIKLWEGPGGYDEISNKAWDFDKRSREMMYEKAREASKRKQELESELENLVKERDELSEEVFDLYDQIFIEMIVDHMMTKPDTQLPSSFSYDPGKDYGDRADAYDNYNWLWKTYGIDAAEWYLENQKLPMESNPFIPAGAYLPLAKGDSTDLPQGAESTFGTKDTATIASLISATAKRKEEEERKKRNVTASFKQSGQFISEDRKKLLREIKQPLNEVGELQPQKLKNYRPNFKGRYVPQNTPDVTASKEANDMVRAKNAAGQTWRESDKYWGGYESQERANVIYDHVGHGQLYWDEIVANNQGKKTSRDREIQEELNKKYSLIAEKEMTSIAEQETLDAPKDPLFKKVRNKLRDKIDYQDKPSKLGYPNTPPKEQEQGYHPDYGKRKDYYKKLDPHSADAMPETGDLETDDTVEKQKTLRGLYAKHQRRVQGTMHLVNRTPNF